MRESFGQVIIFEKPRVGNTPAIVGRGKSNPKLGQVSSKCVPGISQKTCLNENLLAGKKKQELQMHFEVRLLYSADQVRFVWLEMYVYDRVAN